MGHVVGVTKWYSFQTIFFLLWWTKYQFIHSLTQICELNLRFLPIINYKNKISFCIVFTAGDYVKFVWTQAAASTMIAWGIHSAPLGYIKSGELSRGLDCLRWASDFLLKCHVAPEELYGQVLLSLNFHSQIVVSSNSNDSPHILVNWYVKMHCIKRIFWKKSRQIYSPMWRPFVMSFIFYLNILVFCFVFR